MVFCEVCVQRHCRHVQLALSPALLDVFSFHCIETGCWNGPLLMDVLLLLMVVYLLVN